MHLTGESISRKVIIKTPPMFSLSNVKSFHMLLVILKKKKESQTKGHFICFMFTSQLVKPGFIYSSYYIFFSCRVTGRA